MESFHSVLEKECLQRNEFQSYQEAYEIVTNYLLFYNQRRIHGSLYDLSPVEFGKAFALQLITPFVVKV
ncbi:IS3 family transposase [Streptococcus pneumoniae]